MAIAQAALTFQCAYFSTYDIYGTKIQSITKREQSSQRKALSSPYSTVDHVEQHNFLMINYAYPDIASIQNGVFSNASVATQVYQLSIYYSTNNLMEIFFNCRKMPMIILVAKSKHL
ncbi:Hypothetical_protein [Hexamita inflata]|uniref:Hypothetical_protein n=1 Tax=Hexamita inflata TaxID=28002 RepID=A0ABP1KCU0_9EUKA